MKVLYIAGYGRSGSTILDVLLGSHDQTVSIGEAAFLGEDWQHPHRECACGEQYSSCPFWKDLFDASEQARHLTRVSQLVEKRRALPQLLLGMLSEERRRAYRMQIKRLFGYVARRSNTDVIVDSSKSARHAAGRFWALRQIAGLDVRVVHLVRDGRQTLRSVVEKGSNWELEGYRDDTRLLAERTIIGWVLANGIACTLGKRLGSDSYLRIKFENLLRTPEKVLREIGMFVGLDFSLVIDRVRSDESFAVGHNVGGNRVRKNQSIRLRRRANEEPRRWSGLNAYHRVVFATFAQWLNRLFGYKW